MGEKYEGKRERAAHAENGRKETPVGAPFSKLLAPSRLLALSLSRHQLPLWVNYRMVQGVAARSPAATAVPSPPPPVLLLPSLPSSSHTVDWLADWTRTAGARLQGYQLWAVEQR